MKKKVTDINEFVNILEEISWIVDRKSINLHDVVKMLRASAYTQNHSDRASSVTHLVGILPTLFMDPELFEKNDDLLDFAEQILKLKPKRGGKRSRTESIGWIVCELSCSEGFIREDLVEALDELVKSDEKKKSLKKKRQMPSFSWNEAIAKLNEDRI